MSYTRTLPVTWRFDMSYLHSSNQYCCNTCAAIRPPAINRRNKNKTHTHQKAIHRFKDSEKQSNKSAVKLATWSVVLWHRFEITAGQLTTPQVVG